MASSVSLDVLKSFFLDANRTSGVRSDVEIDPTIEGNDLTQQQFKEQCDVNNIVKQYALLGYTADTFDQLAQRTFADAGRFVDVSNVPDIVTASNMMAEVQENFIQNIPAKVREMFGHNAMEFYKYVSNPVNHNNVIEMLRDVRNFAAPTADQLQDGVLKNSAVSTSASSDNEKK